MFLYSSTRCIIIFCLLVATSFSVVRSHDVFDMFNDVKDQVVERLDQASAKVIEKVQKHVSNLKDTQTCPSTFKTEYRTVITAYRQLIKDWIEKFPSKNANEYRLFVELSSSEFDRLDRFASASSYEEKDVLHNVHIISDLLKRMVYKVEDKTILSSLTWSAWLRSFDINTIIKYVLVMIMIGAISFISIRTHLRRGRWFTTFFIAVFIVSVMQNWYTLYQDAQAKIDEVLMKKLPKHCQGQSMGVFDIIKDKLGRFVQLPTNECLEYHKAIRATPHAQVTPVQALSMTLAQLFVTPMGAIGESLSHFFAGTMRHVPIVLWPIVIIIILFIFIALALMYSRYEIHLPFFLGALRPARHAAVPPPTNTAEPIEGRSGDPPANVKRLEDRIKQLELELEQKTNLELEHNSTSPIRASRSSSIIRNTTQQRERSSSNQRSAIDDELRQRQPPPPGFRQDILN